MSEHKNLRQAQPGMKVFCRNHPHDDLFIMKIYTIVQSNQLDQEAFQGDIVLRFETELNRVGYFDVVFLPDGRQRSGGWQQCGHSIYPMTKKYKAIYKLEKEYAKND